MHCDKKAFTLIEILIATVILGVIVVGLTPIIISANTFFARSMENIGLQQNSILVMETMVKDIRNASSITLVSPTEVDVNFVGTTVEVHTYRLQDDKIIYSDSAGASRTVADNVSELTFSVRAEDLIIDQDYRGVDVKVKLRIGTGETANTFTLHTYTHISEKQMTTALVRNYGENTTYETIQEAIDDLGFLPLNPSQEDLDRITIDVLGKASSPTDSSDSYKELVEIFNKDVILRGGWGPGFTERDPDTYYSIIDADIDGDGTGDGTPIRCQANSEHSQIDGFVIRNGSNPASHWYDAGGIYASNSEIGITNNIIRDNVCMTNGAVYFDGCSRVRIEGNHILSNQGNLAQTAPIIIRYSSNVVITGNEIKENTNFGGAGILVFNTQDGGVEITGNTIDNNRGNDYGSMRCELVLKGGAVINNNTITNNICRRNTGIDGASGIYARSIFGTDVSPSASRTAVLEIKNNGVSNNIGCNAAGISVFNVHDSPPGMTGIDISDNVVENNGDPDDPNWPNDPAGYSYGGITCYNGDGIQNPATGGAIINNNTVKRNTTRRDGGIGAGGICLYQINGGNGGVSLGRTDAVQITNNTVEDNRGGEVAGIFCHRVYNVAPGMTGVNISNNFVLKNSDYPSNDYMGPLVSWPANWHQNAAGYSMGGILCSDVRRGGVIVNDNVIFGNSCKESNRGGASGIYLREINRNDGIDDTPLGRNDFVQIMRNRVTNNRGGYIGGIYCDHIDHVPAGMTALNISENIVEDNGSSDVQGKSTAGGILCGGVRNGGGLIIDNNKVNRNVCRTSNELTAGGISFSSINCANTPAARDDCVRITDNEIKNNTGGQAAALYCGNLINVPADKNGLMISGNIMQENTAGRNYGGIYCNNGIPSAVIEDNVISNNSSSTNLGAGGIYSQVATMRLSGNLISGNSSSLIGGIFLSTGGTAEFINNTVSDNNATYGGLVTSGGAGYTIKNCIFWGNGDDLYDWWGLLRIDRISYSNIEDGDFQGQRGNISIDPSFVDGTEDVPDYYYLGNISPCIDAGDPDPAYNDPDGTVNDMGFASWDGTRTLAYIVSGVLRDGFKVVDVTNPLSPVLVGTGVGGTNALMRRSTSLAIQGNYAYITDNERDHGLAVLDITDPYNPVVVGQLTGYGGFGTTNPYFRNAYRVFVQDSYAYVADSANSAGLKIVDISDSTNPTLVGKTLTTTTRVRIGRRQHTQYHGIRTAYAVHVQGDYAYVADNFFDDRFAIDRGGLQIIDISDPTDPHTVDPDGKGFAQHPNLTTCRDVFVRGNYAYLAGRAGLAIVNVSDPLLPVLEGWHNAPDLGQAIFVEGDYAYVADMERLGGLKIFDISDPTAPNYVGGITYEILSGDPVEIYQAHAVYVKDGIAYVGDAQTSYGLRIVDVSDPANPELIGYLGGDDVSTGLDVFVR